MQFSGGFASTLPKQKYALEPKISFNFQGTALRVWKHLKKAIWVFWIKMKMILNKSPLGQNAPQGLLYTHDYLVASYKSTILKKNILHFFFFFFNY